MTIVVGLNNSPMKPGLSNEENKEDVEKKIIEKNDDDTKSTATNLTGLSIDTNNKSNESSNENDMDVHKLYDYDDLLNNINETNKDTNTVTRKNYEKTCKIEGTTDKTALDVTFLKHAVTEMMTPNQKRVVNRKIESSVKKSEKKDLKAKSKMGGKSSSRVKAKENTKQASAEASMPRWQL